MNTNKALNMNRIRLDKYLNKGEVSELTELFGYGSRESTYSALQMRSNSRKARLLRAYVIKNIIGPRVAEMSEIVAKSESYIDARS